MFEHFFYKNNDASKTMFFNRLSKYDFHMFFNHHVVPTLDLLRFSMVLFFVPHRTLGKGTRIVVGHEPHVGFSGKADAEKPFKKKTPGPLCVFQIRLDFHVLRGLPWFSKDLHGKVKTVILQDLGVSWYTAIRTPHPRLAHENQQTKKDVNQRGVARGSVHFLEMF